MKKIYLLLFPLFFVVVGMQGQTTILDFETPATSTVFQYFGSPLDGTLNETLPNPNPSGINTSATVAKYVKPAVAEVWAGCFSNPNPTAVIDLIENGKVSVKVHMDHIGSLSLKLEGSVDGGDNWVITVPNTKVNEWEEIVFDASLPSIEAPFTAASGHVYTRVVLFFDFGQAGTGVDVTSYFDDIVALPNSAVTTTILDFETPATTTSFQYFGSGLDGTLNQVIANPNASGINTSSQVAQYIKPGVAQTWAGAFSNPDPTTLVDLSNGGQVCVKVHMDHIGNLALKLEGGTSGQANWLQQVSNTKVGEWEELCFDASLPSLEAPFEAATGAYTRVVLFFDFGQAGTGSDVTSYFDDVVVKSSGAPSVRTVNFRVDMNSYTANFDQVYLSGSFNNWSGDATPLADPDFDGIWEGSISVTNGSYEYKVTLDNWAAQEEFTGVEECTKRDVSGQFVNRLLLVSADTDVPQFCFNSCYACGEERTITFRLGMGGVVPNAEGVWLAGGGNFDVPGGKFKMNDDDSDGVYELVVPRKVGFQSYYTFTNGPCADYSCKENLAGLPCGDPNNFNDRFLPAIQDNTTIETCFGACFTNVECVSGLNALTEDPNLFQILGNPSVNGFSVLDFGKAVTADKTVSLLNSEGRMLGQWVVAGYSANFRIATADLPAGIYLVTVREGDRYLTKKLVR